MTTQHEALRRFPVVVEQAVAWGEMDAYNHVNNVVYFRYFENSRLEYFRRLGWFELEKLDNIGPILASTSARFRKAVVYPDRLAIGARAVQFQADRFVMEHVIVAASSGAVVTEGQGLIVAFDYNKGIKATIPAALKQAIAELEATAGNTLD